VSACLRRLQRSAGILNRELEFNFDVREAIERFRRDGGDNVIVAISADADRNALEHDMDS
jgi:hypothetical protein